MVHALVAALSLVLLAANPPPPPADAPASDAPPPKTAVVGGHHIQPRANPGQASAGLSKRDADDVDRLYQELMRQTAPDASGAKASTAPQ